MNKLFLYKYSSVLRCLIFILGSEFALYKKRNQIWVLLSIKCGF